MVYVKSYGEYELSPYLFTFPANLSVSSEIVASVSMPPCAQEGEDDTENDVDNDDVNKFIHKLDI